MYPSINHKIEDDDDQFHDFSETTLTKNLIDQKELKSSINDTAVNYGTDHHTSKQRQVKLTFEKLSYEIRIKCSKEEEMLTGQKYIRQKIVKDACGYALPGETLFIMGASGAGKTSLLNILSDRIASKSGGKIKGKIQINDSLELKGSAFGKVGAYVMQDDVLLEVFTPREAIRFAARLKLQGLSNEDQEKRVEQIIEDLNLVDAADTKIGSVMTKTISGGEKKRTAIGVELVTDPSLVLLDEPTSGLDSFKALSIVKLLNDLARTGKTIISTIHQPSSEAFALFDRLILMCDGYIVYQGYAKNSASYFKSIGYEVPKHTNPADYYMDVLSINYPKLKTDIKKTKYLKRNYDQLLYDLNYAESQKLQLAPVNLQEMTFGKASFFQQFKCLLDRSWIQCKRDWRPIYLKLFQMIAISIITIGIFWKMPKNDYKEITSYVGCLFFCSSIQLYVGILGAILVFIEERPLFVRESANRMYGVLPYFLAKDIVQIPSHVIIPLIFSVFYFGIGTDITFDQFVVFYFVQLMVGFATSAYGQVIGSIFQRASTACQFTPIVVMPFVLFSGFWTNLDTYPNWIGWLQYFSPVRYGFETVVRNEFEDYQMPWFVPNPIDHLNFDIGLPTCLLMLIVTTYLLKVLACIMLKISIKRFQ